MPFIPPNTQIGRDGNRYPIGDSRLQDEPTQSDETTPGHLADTHDAHDASAVTFTPAGGIAATTVQGALAELDTEKQAASTALVTTGANLAHKLGTNGDEPGAFIAWTADDGYTKQVDYFAMLDSKGIDGTLFLTKNWVNQAGTNPTWNDTYITQAQVQAIADAGHELATHGVNHENHSSYLTANGAAAFVAFFATAKTYIETTYGVTVRTGAYPGGISDTRVRELMSRIGHEFYRGTKGVIAHNSPPPLDVPAIDVQNLTEAAIKAHVDSAIANRCVAVFLVHGGMSAADITKYGNVVDYATSLGVPQGTFYQAMSQRRQWRSTGVFVDAQGNAFYRKLRSYRVEITRDDATFEQAFFDIDEATNAPYFDAVGGTAWEFRRRVDFKDQVEVRGQATLYGVLSARAIENIFQPTAYVSDTEFILRIRRSAAAGTDPSVDLLRIDHRGKLNLRGPAAELLVQSTTGTSRAQITNGGVVRANDTAGAEKASLNGTAGTLKLWDTGTSTLKTGTLTNGVLSWA